jgi:hypothetical protein
MAKNGHRTSQLHTLDAASKEGATSAAVPATLSGGRFHGQGWHLPESASTTGWAAAEFMFGLAPAHF